MMATFKHKAVAKEWQLTKPVLPQ